MFCNWDDFIKLDNTKDIKVFYVYKDDFKKSILPVFFDEEKKGVIISNNLYMERKNEIDKYYRELIKNFKDPRFLTTSNILNGLPLIDITKNENIRELYVNGDLDEWQCNCLRHSKGIKKVEAKSCDIRYYNEEKIKFDVENFTASDLLSIGTDIVKKINAIVVSNNHDAIQIRKTDKPNVFLMDIGRNYYDRNKKGIIQFVKNKIKNEQTTVELGSLLYYTMTSFDDKPDNFKMIKNNLDYDFEKVVVESSSINNFANSKQSEDECYALENSEDVLKFAKTKNKYKIYIDSHKDYSLELLQLIEDCDNISFSVQSDRKELSVRDLIEYKLFLNNIINEINSKNLSTFEKYVYAYKITMLYKPYSIESDNESHAISRYPEFMLQSDQCVCVGYAEFLKNIIDGLEDENLKAETYTCKKNLLHQRCFIGIKDPKYRINGVYISDPTADSSGYFKRNSKVLKNVALKKTGEMEYCEGEIDVSDALFLDRKYQNIDEDNVDYYKNYFKGFKITDSKYITPTDIDYADKVVIESINIKQPRKR